MMDLINLIWYFRCLWISFINTGANKVQWNLTFGHRNNILHILERRNSWPDADINYCPVDISHKKEGARTTNKKHGNHETFFSRVQCQPPELLAWTGHRHRMQNRLPCLTGRLVDPPATAMYHPNRKAVMQMQVHGSWMQCRLQLRVDMCNTYMPCMVVGWR